MRHRRLRLRCPAKLANLSSNYSLSANSASTDTSGLFFGPSFYGTPSGPNLTGARNPTVQASPSLVTPMMTTYTYHVLDDLTAVSQAGLASVGGVQVPGQPRSYAYDSPGRLTASTTPESGTTNFYYTTSGGATCAADASAVCRKTDARGITATYTYDGLNRVTLVTYSDSTPQVAYAYGTSSTANNNGRLVSVTVGTGSPAVAAESYTYDPLGRITVASESVGSAQYNVGYGYNPDNTLATITYPSGRTISYSYSAAGRALSAVDATNGINYATAATYAPTGALAGATFGASSSFAGITVTNQYNKRLQPAMLSASAASQTVLSLSYDFHLGTADNGNVYGITNNLDGVRPNRPNGSVQFTYDALNRVTSASTLGPQPSE